MKRHNLIPLGIPGEEVTWYSDYVGLTDGEPKRQGSGFHSSPAETNEEFAEIDENEMASRLQATRTVYKEN